MNTRLIFSLHGSTRVDYTLQTNRQEIYQNGPWLNRLHTVHTLLANGGLSIIYTVRAKESISHSAPPSNGCHPLHPFDHPNPPDQACPSHLCSFHVPLLFLSSFVTDACTCFYLFSSTRQIPGTPQTRRRSIVCSQKKIEFRLKDWWVQVLGVFTVLCCNFYLCMSWLLIASFFFWWF